jgi:hypothetical protein
MFKVSSNTELDSCFAFAISLDSQVNCMDMTLIFACHCEYPSEVRYTQNSMLSIVYCSEYRFKLCGVSTTCL